MTARAVAQAVVAVPPRGGSIDGGRRTTRRAGPEPCHDHPTPSGAHGSPRAGRSIPGRPPELVRPAPEVTARFSQGGYVFPIFGPAAYGNTFGAFRPDVVGKWHHGEDLVAPIGTPLLAVADGSIFSVGWNDLGGWRLWLRDDGGNEFYYAHLSAYSPLAVAGKRVKAGEVIGFVGDSGASGVPHLHFEIHPAELLQIRLPRRRRPVPVPHRLAACRGRLVRRRAHLPAERRRARRARGGSGGVAPAPAPSCWTQTTSRPRPGSCRGR